LVINLKSHVDARGWFGSSRFVSEWIGRSIRMWMRCTEMCCFRCLQCGGYMILRDS
jgi:hypothetical protein